MPQTARGLLGSSRGKDQTRLQACGAQDLNGPGRFTPVVVLEFVASLSHFDARHSKSVHFSWNWPVTFHKTNGMKTKTTQKKRNTRECERKTERERERERERGREQGSGETSVLCCFCFSSRHSHSSMDVLCGHSQVPWEASWIIVLATGPMTAEITTLTNSPLERQLKTFLVDLRCSGKSMISSAVQCRQRSAAKSATSKEATARLCARRSQQPRLRGHDDCPH